VIADLTITSMFEGSGFEVSLAYSYRLYHQLSL